MTVGMIIYYSLSLAYRQQTPCRRIVSLVWLIASKCLADIYQAGTAQWPTHGVTIATNHWNSHFRK